MSTAQRDKQREAFAQQHLGNVDLQPLQQDASFRRYFRVTGKRLLLMDAPPEHENADAFVQIARALESLGQRPPRIEAADLAQGFVLLEDFGEDTFTRLLTAGEDETALYSAAVDLLVRLHTRADAAKVDVPPYDSETLQKEAVLFVDWYAPAQNVSISLTQKGEFVKAWQTVFDALPTYTPTLVLRDFHVDNLMRLKINSGYEYGLLDFQDALIGHPAYDLMSLLEDARRDLQPCLANKMQQRYFSAVPENDTDAFRNRYAALALQRHMKVAGIFNRLNQRDGKPNYLKHVPRVLRLAASHLDQPVLAPVKNWLAKHFADWLESNVTTGVPH